MQTFENHIQWGAVKDVARKLHARGYQALLAGGCVRDYLLQRTPHDFDIATDARPEAIEALFPNALTVGREFGVTILPFSGFQIEVATFRKDGPYEDGRRPTHVVFCTPEEDARRRDFTVNALFYDLKAQTILDYVGGQNDLRDRLIRAVGDPDHRFAEDKLRILRAVRFAAQLDFDIEQETFAAVKRRYREVGIVSLERIRDELVKLVKSTGADRGLTLMLATRLTEVVLPEVSDLLTRPDVSSAASSRLRAGATSVEIGILHLLYDCSEVMMPAKNCLNVLRGLLKRLKFSNVESDAIIWVLKMKSVYLQPNNTRPADLIRGLAHPYSVFAEEFFGSFPLVGPELQKTWQQIHQDILSSRRELPARFVDGDDLQKMGVSRGPRLGQLLDEVFNLQLEGRFNTRDEALVWVQTQF